MSELINAAVQIKDPFTLFAFLAVVLLVAFKTKTVPESVFKLLSAKITRERFYRLLNRSLAYAFVVFLVLCGVAVVGQVLDYMTTAKAASVDELKAELVLRQSDDTSARRALEEFQKGLALAQDEKLTEAIASLESSLLAVPTTTARETLAVLYAEAGNRERATELAERGASDAREAGGALGIVKADRLLATVRERTSGTQDSSPGATPAPAAEAGTSLETGAIVVAGTGATLYYVYDSGGEKELAYAYTGKPIELFPGAYTVALNRTRQQVVVRAKRETTVPTGSVVLPGSGQTLYYVFDSAGQQELAYAYTGKPIELFPGTYIAELNRNRSTVRVVASQDAAATTR